MFNAIHASFSFLTILVKGKMYSDKQMQQSIYFYPFVGAVISLISASLAMLVFYFTYQKELSAILFLLAECLLSRGLHHDGLSDIADAYGSNKTGDEFRRILKDSRIGSFGVLALIFYFLISTILIASLINMNILSVQLHDIIAFIILMVIGGMWSRLGLIALPAFAKLYEPKEQNFSLARVMFSKYQKKYFFLWLCTLLITIFYLYGSIMLVSLILLTFLLIYPLYAISKRENGYNGDFLGASCLLFEVAYYFAGLITITRF